MESATGKAGAGGEFAKQVTNWATPRATDGEKGGPNCRGGRGDPILAGQVCQWPTPSQRDGDARRGATNPESNAWKNKVARGAVNAAGMLSDDLKSSASAWPTPTAQDCEQSGSANAYHLTLYRSTKQWPTPAARDYRSESAGGGVL